MSDPVLPDAAPGRVVGVDVARALALFGMMATHLLPGRMSNEVPWAQQIAGGRASALFAVLAGVSIALVSGRTEPLRGRERRAASVRLVGRALLIGAIGLALGAVPTAIAVILTSYAALFLLGLPFLGLGARALVAWAAAWVVAAPVGAHLLRPLLPAHEVGSPEPQDLLRPGHLLSELLLTGYYPAAVWVAYLLAGMALGRLPLGRPATAARVLVVGSVLAVAATFGSRLLLARPGASAALASTYPNVAAPDTSLATEPGALDALLTHGLSGSTPTGSWWWLAVVAPHTGTPLDLAQTIGSALAVTGLCILLTQGRPRVWAAVFGAGTMTLSLYTLHVLMMARGWWPDWEGPEHYDDQVLVVAFVGAFFALVPLRGPLETVVAVASRQPARWLVPPSGHRPPPRGQSAGSRTTNDPHVDPLKRMDPMSAPRRAVIGSGVAGLTAAHVLSTRGPVTLYEADARLGGHADTHEVQVDGRTVGVDTGFIVHNDRTYPTLLRLFAELGVATQESDMSMSVRDDESGLEYAGARKARGLFPRAANFTNAAYLRMLTEVKKFHREARDVLSREASDVNRDETLGSFAVRCGFSPYFTRHFLEPVVAAVWSCDPEVSLQYPARYLFEFLDHHGMLTVFGSPTWRTVTGGSKRYVEALATGMDEVRLSTPVHSVTETGDGVVVVDAHGDTQTYDSVVIAAHPHQALAMLSAPTDLQREVLGAIHYSSNVAQLHTDESVLPHTSGARASWNYWRRPELDGGTGVLVTYDLTRLQRLDVPGTRFLVTLNGVDCVDQDKVIDTMSYEHPLYTPESVAAQRRLPEINTSRIAFAGAYHGWGFHEDGALSGANAAAALGVDWDEVAAEARPREALTR